MNKKVLTTTIITSILILCPLIAMLIFRYDFQQPLVYRARYVYVARYAVYHGLRNEQVRIPWQTTYFFHSDRLYDYPDCRRVRVVYAYDCVF